MKECVIVYRRSLTHQEIKDAEAEELEDEAHVAEVVEPVEHPAAETIKDFFNQLTSQLMCLECINVLLNGCGVQLLNLFQDVDFKLRSLAVFVDILNDLQRYDLVPVKTNRGRASLTITQMRSAASYELSSLTLTTFPKVPSPKVAKILSETK